jgi:hypothetical protein
VQAHGHQQPTEVAFAGVVAETHPTIRVGLCEPS